MTIRSGQEVTLYPNQQLRSVSIQAFFRGRFSVLARLPEIQDSLSARMPNVLVPFATEGSAPGLQPYQFRPDSAHEALFVALNQVSYYSFAYPGHEAFQREGVQMMRAVLDMCGVQDLERVGFVYDNEIGVARDLEGAFALDHVLRAKEVFGWATAGPLTDCNLNVTGAWSGGTKNVRLWIEPRGNLHALRLKISVFVLPGGVVDDLRAAAARGHDEARATFEAMISDSFRAYLRGDEVEQ